VKVLAQQLQEQLALTAATQRKQFRASLKGQSFLVKVPERGDDDSTWSDYCYRLLPDADGTGPLLLHRQRLQDNCLCDHPDAGLERWMAWEKLGFHFVVPVGRERTVSQATQDSLEALYQGAFAAGPPPQGGGSVVWGSKDKSKVTGHFKLLVQQQQHRYTQSALVDERNPTTPLWSGLTQQGEVTFDWESMRAKVTSESNFVRVERSGSWVFYTATNAEVKVTTGKFTLTKQQRVKAGYVKLLTFHGMHLQTCCLRSLTLSREQL
jgi:hypothetical protein